MTAGPGPLQITLQNAQASWFPMAEQSSSAIRRKIIENSYRSDPSSLVGDIKQDFALFSYCVRELVRKARQDGEALQEVYPLNLLEVTDIGSLVTLVNQAPQHIDAFGARQGTREQIKTLTSPLLAAVISEELAGGVSLNSDVAFATSLMRQLGLTLMAWSLPSVFNRCCKSLRGTETVDRALNRQLGFSPLMLGVNIAQEWQIARPIRYAMGDAALQEELSSEQRTVADELRKICRIGEALTRAEDPWYYPRTKATFEEAEREISRILGLRGMERLRSKIAAQCPLVLDSVPEFLRTAPAVAVPATLATNALQLSPHFAEEIARFNDLSQTNRDRNDLLAVFKQRVFPSSGFLVGVAYVLSPEYGSFVPRFTMGKPGLAKLESVTTNSLSVVARASRARTPQFERRGADLMVICGALGQPIVSGVLELSFLSEVFPDQAHAAAAFNALRTALEASVHW